MYMRLLSKSTKYKAGVQIPEKKITYFSKRFIKLHVFLDCGTRILGKVTGLEEHPSSSGSA
jgi:hypothetical protein